MRFVWTLGKFFSSISLSLSAYTFKYSKFFLDGCSVLLNQTVDFAIWNRCSGYVMFSVFHFQCLNSSRRRFYRHHTQVVEMTNVVSHSSKWEKWMHKSFIIICALYHLWWIYKNQCVFSLLFSFSFSLHQKFLINDGVLLGKTAHQEFGFDWI